MLQQVSKALKELNYNLQRKAIRGYLFTRNNDAILVDIDICNNTNYFDYAEYTKEQNEFMFFYSSLYRFNVENIDDVQSMKAELLRYLNKDFHEDDIKNYGANRELANPDPTPPEYLFEDMFIEVYGREAVQYLNREFPIIDINGSTRFCDYVIHKNDYRIIIEENGVSYHHPIIIGREKYKSQLQKQNSIVSYGDKVYRWALESMKDKNNFAEEVKQYLGESSSFKLSQKVTVSRQFKLYAHQEKIVDKIAESKESYNSSNLVVLPTGTGKTEILIHDLVHDYKKNPKFKALIIVPSVKLKSQFTTKLNERLADYSLTGDHLQVGLDVNDNVLVKTNAWTCRNYYKFKPKHFTYIAIDEAHHAVAPALGKAIKHFQPESLIGLTATPKRLDHKQLEDMFGQYETSLSLTEAIEQDLLAPIKAFRLKSNIDLSEIRFNGRDYVNSDLQKRIVVPSRDQLVVDTLKRYFADSSLPSLSGLIFCVSVAHAESLSKRMKQNGLSAESVSGKDKNSTEKIEKYQNGEIQFLTTCSLLSEGWDSPRTSIIVMARPTMSKVLYTQQLGRGTRKHDGKEALYVIDVVDNYSGVGSFNNRPWSIHALLGVDNYLPWGNVLDSTKTPTEQDSILISLSEQVRKIEQINIFTFEKLYADYMSEEQVAREYFVSTGTIKSWIKKRKIRADVEVPFLDEENCIISHLRLLNNIDLD